MTDTTTPPADAPADSAATAAPESGVVQVLGEVVHLAGTAGHDPIHTVAQYTLLRQTLVDEATEGEFDLFVQVCNATGLNPFARQIHAVMRYDNRKKRKVMAIQTGIDGYRLIANRSDKYLGQEGPYWCGADGVWTDVWLSDEPPAAAKVGVRRAGFAETLFAVARFSSYAQWYNPQGGGAPKLSGQWGTMPEVMIAKCAEALALRKAFPQEMGGIYTSEEMGQASHAATAEGWDSKDQQDSHFDTLRALVENVADPVAKAEILEWCRSIDLKRGTFSRAVADELQARIDGVAADAELVSDEADTPEGGTAAEPVAAGIEDADTRTDEQVAADEAAAAAAEPAEAVAGPDPTQPPDGAAEPADEAQAGPVVPDGPPRDDQAAPDGPEHPCAAGCLGCGAAPDEPCIPPCRCDDGEDCAPAAAIIAGAAAPADDDTAPAEPVADGPVAPTAAEWKVELKAMGLSQGEALRTVRDLAEQKGMQAPLSLAQVPVELADDLFARLTTLSATKAARAAAKSGE